MNFFPIFPFNCQFQLFLHNFIQNSENFSALRAIWSFFAQFCDRNGKLFEALRLLKDAMKIFISVGKKNREEIGMFLFEEGEKIGTFGQNIYPWIFAKNLRENGISSPFWRAPFRGPWWGHGSSIPREKQVNSRIPQKLLVLSRIPYTFFSISNFTLRLGLLFGA